MDGYQRVTNWLMTAAGWCGAARGFALALAALLLVLTQLFLLMESPPMVFTYMDF